jgi:dienelactone hydrolase
MNREHTLGKNLASSMARTFWQISLLPLLVCTLLNQGSEVQPSFQPTVQQQRVAQLHQQSQRDSFDTFYYKNGGLNIEAYWYKPEGNGPFPLVIYNHGSRAGQERTEIPFRWLANVLQANGFAVLVPERRGYGKSDGQTFREEVGHDLGQILMRRFREEASDVLAGLDYLKEASSRSNSLLLAAGVIDFKRVAIMGWSHGGVISILAASEKHDFAALINQAGAALTWNRSPTLQNELTAAARRIKIPALCMDAENDATTDAAKAVGDAVKSSGQFERTIIYPAFTPTSNPNNIAPGHLIFSMQGISIWQDDVLTFLRNRLNLNSPARVSSRDDRPRS